MRYNGEGSPARDLFYDFIFDTNNWSFPLCTQIFNWLYLFKKTEARIIRASHPESLNILENGTAVHPITLHIINTVIIQDTGCCVKPLNLYNPVSNINNKRQYHRIPFGVFINIIPKGFLNGALLCRPVLPFAFIQGLYTNLFELLHECFRFFYINKSS